jgi:hypothetical protein
MPKKKASKKLAKAKSIKKVKTLTKDAKIGI